MNENNDPSPALTVLEPAALAVWHVKVVARAHPLLLPRILQKLAVPDIELWEVRYRAGAPCGLCIRTTAARVRLTSAKLQTLMGVERVEVHAA